MTVFKSFFVPLYMLVYRIALLFRNVQVGGRCYVKKTEFAGKAVIEDNCRISGNPAVQIGKNFYLNVGCHLLGDIKIGNNVMIGPQTIIWGRDHGMEPGEPMKQQACTTKKIIIEDDVWIGAHVTILKGVKINRGAVIAAGAVVTKSVSADKIVAGVPARVMADRSSDDD